MKSLIIGSLALFLWPLSAGLAATSGYDQQVRELFMQGCLDEGEEAACRCVLEGLEEAVPEEAVRNGDVTDEAIDQIIARCAEAMLSR